MGPIEIREKQIRDLINNPWKQQYLINDKVKWNKLCASMDVVGDTQLAINNFITLPTFKVENGGYLFLYGLLQAFFLQQDAVSHLSEALFKKTIDWEEEFPEIFQIRDLRNDSIGHPTKRGKDHSFHFIARYSVSNESFQLMSYKPTDNETSFRAINLKEFITSQENGIIQILDKVIEVLKKEYNDHKMKFTNRKLCDLIPNTFGYSIEKIYEGIRNDHPLAATSLTEITNLIETIKAGINERYGHLSALPGLNDLVRRIDYILHRLNQLVKTKELKNNNDAEVFLDGFTDRFNELKEMLNEIDNEFS